MSATVKTAKICFIFIWKKSENKKQRAVHNIALCNLSKSSFIEFLKGTPEALVLSGSQKILPDFPVLLSRLHP